ncbi:MAG: efflux RND transporter periplasmic adaptor subunit [Saprospiraceae bacterium]|nr:efflux RND transporter periplasmic adaptor subunit [Saprospiraceae bacterium]
MRYLLPMLAIALFLQSCGPAEDQKAAAAEEAAVRPDTPLVVREIVGIARIEPPEKIISINAQTAGYVREIRFGEGSRVQKGDVLLLLDNEVEQAQLRQAQSKLQTQRAAITAAEASLESLRVKRNNARNTLERNQKLAAGNALTAQQLDDSRFAADELDKQVSAQQAAVAQQQSRLKELEADLAYYQTLLQQRTLTAPMTGTFLSSGIKPGQYITNSSVLGELAADGPYQAVTEVDELFAGRVQLGQRALVRLQGSTEPLATGKVVYVAPFLRQKSLFSDSPDNLEDRRVREVRVQLDKQDNILIGSRVECVIEVGR